MRQVLLKFIVAVLIVAALVPNMVFAKEVPMKLKGTGTLTPIMDSAGNVVGGNLDATGQATHLGKWTQSGTLVFTPHPSDPTLILASGDSVFIAANGDELYVTITDAVLDSQTGIATGNFEYVGGTGRFMNATGSTPFTVIQDPSGTFTVTAKGTIDY